MTALDILTAEADRYDERLDRALRQYRREHDATFAADLDIQYPRPAARTTDELYRDVVAWIASLPRQASPRDILHTPRTRLASDDGPDVVVAVQITAEQAEQIRRRRAERAATLTALVENNRPPGWTPHPEDFAPAPDDTLPGREATMPALTVAPEGTYTQHGAVETGPRGRFGHWVDERLERAETWWQNKRAAAERMGVGDE